MVKDLNDPTNRDSIFAMLTPGEYVLNKEATTMFGPLVEKMNQAGLQQRHAENQQVIQRNMGGVLKQYRYNTGGLVDFIKKEEGWRDKAYQDPAGIWTIGYGRTTNPDGSPIRPGQTTSREAEDTWITNRINQEREAVRKYGEQHGYNWDSNKVDALASFRYNGGQGMLEQVTGGGKRDDATIASKMLEYNKANVDGKLTPLAGLTKRRQAEASMFTGDQAPEAQPQEQQVASLTTPLNFREAAEEKKQSNPLAGLGSALIEGAVGGLMTKRPLSHMASRQYTSPEYVPSVTARGPVSTQPRRVNTGGVVYANTGGSWWDWIKDKAFSGEDPNAGYSDMTQQDYVDMAQNQQDVPSMGYNVSIPESMTVPPEQVTPPIVVPNSDEDILQSSSDNQQHIAALPIGHPDRVKAIESGQFIPTQGDLEWDEQRWFTNEELRRQQLQSAVTAPDAPGAQFTQDRVDALTDQLDSLGVPPQEQGVGTQVTVGGPDAPPLVDVPQIGPAPDDVGAVPGLDVTAPTPQQVIDSQPQDLFTNPVIMPAPGEEEQAYEQAVTTDAPVSLPVESTELREAAEEEGLLAVDNQPPEEYTQKQKDEGIKNTISELEETDESNRFDTASVNIDTVEETGKIEVQKPGLFQSALGALKGVFGDLFDSKELKRAAVMYLGARATGMSGGQALAFAGKTYLGRLDAKEGAFQKAALSGDYTKESLKTYKETGDPLDLIPKGQPIVELGNSKEFFTKDGRRIQARQVQIGDSKYWMDGDQPINLNTVHEDASRAPGTQEYRERIQTESKQYSDVFKELQDRFGKFETKSGDAYATDLTPGKVGLNAAKWATKNNVPPDAMGQLLDNAYAAARADSKDGKRVKNIEAYLNNEYIKSQVGDPTLFEGASGEKVDLLMGAMANQARTLEQFQGMSNTAISTTIIQTYRPKWTNLSEEERKSYTRRSAPGETGFMTYLKDQL